MQNVLLIGGGKGGATLLRMFLSVNCIKVAALIDKNQNSEGAILAKQHGIPVSDHWEVHLTEDLDTVIEVSGDKDLLNQLAEKVPEQVTVIPSSMAYILTTLFNERQELIQKLKDQTYSHDRVFNSMNEGMIFIDTNEKIILFNYMAEKMVGISRGKAVGKNVKEVVPNTKLPRILKTRKPEYNKKQTLHDNLQIIASRLPIIDCGGTLLGALALFKDITDIVETAEEVTNLKEIQSLLEAIIQSSDEAISVVDENGKGMLINKAYTKMIGLSEAEVIGKPADADISEGESIHEKVLETRRPVRGARMKVGPAKKDVIVNCSPLIVDGILKGSVGVIHDVSEIKKLTSELHMAKQIIRTLEAKYTFADIIGDSEEMVVALEQAKLGAKTPATILLRGESGTGKELFAHAIHNESNQKYNKFIRVNCAAISESLLESELFGYEAGSFSGAKRGGKKGFFEEANNGSIFLDEIGELSPITQAKLLRVLQEKEIIRVGGTEPIRVNVRIIAATNVNIEKALAEGRFREDLYYRLNRYPILIPPLRQRKEDIKDLCDTLIQKINQDYGRNVKGITEKALKKLSLYEWPGNVRELENVLCRAMIFSDSKIEWIDHNHLPDLASPAGKSAGEHRVSINEDLSLAAAVEEFEADFIKNQLEKYDYNRTKTARALGISIRSLYYKMDKYSIVKSSMQ
jgi:PAS domain S-box-containing protein